MRLTNFRPQVTLRWLMVAAPVLGLCLAAGIEIWDWSEYISASQKRSDATRRLAFEVAAKGEPIQCRLPSGRRFASLPLSNPPD